MRPIHLALLSFLLAGLSACNNQSSSPPASTQVFATSEQIDELRKEVSKLKLDAMFLKLQVDALESSSATVSTEEQGYDIARTKFGPPEFDTWRTQVVDLP